MATARRVRRCFRCGAILQTTSPKEPGYILKSTIEANKPDALLYCNHCYNKVKALNYSELDLNVDDDIIKILKDAVATDAYIIWVVDLFAFNGILNNDIVKLVKKLKLAVVGTKRDLFSNMTKDQCFERFLKERFNEVGLNPYKISIVGNSDKLDFAAVQKDLKLSRQGHDVYMIGTNTSGKTTLINRVLKSFENKTRWTIKTELYPDTRSKVLEVPLDNSSFFYELPGLSLSTSAVSKVEKDVAKMLVPSRKVKVTLKTLPKDDMIVLGNLVMFAEIKGKATNVKVYTGEKVELKKIAISKYQEFMEENKRRRIVRPFSENFSDFSDYDVFEYDMEKDGLVHDISVQGIGWFSFIAKGQTFRIYIPKGIAIKEYLGKIRPYVEQ